MDGSAARKPEHGWVPAIREQVDKILATDGFAGSRKLSQLLVFLVEQAIEGRSFNEYSIAVDVFHKDESFDPSIDPVVRVYVRRLRTKLNQYRTTMGSQDPVEIVLPPRTYVPMIRRRARPELVSPAGVSALRNIAVRSFRHLSGDTEDEYFCDGLAEELIHALAKLKGLRVISVPALEAGGAVRLSAQELYEQFGVEAVLDGNVRKSANTLRVSAHLTNARGTLIWSEIYKHATDDDALALQSNIADAIAFAICALGAVSLPHCDGLPLVAQKIVI
jgi:TolB-like protein